MLVSGGACFNSASLECHEQAATELEEDLIITSRWKMVQETLKMDCDNTQVWHSSPRGGATAMMLPISEGGSVYSAL